MDEREFELINILGGDLGSNQRDLSRHMNLSLGMINMLIRRLISKGYIRIEQLNKRKVQYILTPKGFSEKMRKSVNYTLKTISSIGLIRNRVKTILVEQYDNGVRMFHYYGNPDISVLVEMVFNEVCTDDCTLKLLTEPPQTEVEGVLLVCQEELGENIFIWNNQIDLVEELAKENQQFTEIKRVNSSNASGKRKMDKPETVQN